MSDQYKVNPENIPIVTGDIEEGTGALSTHLIQLNYLLDNIVKEVNKPHKTKIEIYEEGIKEVLLKFSRIVKELGKTLVNYEEITEKIFKNRGSLTKIDEDLTQLQNIADESADDIKEIKEELIQHLNDATKALKEQEEKIKLILPSVEKKITPIINIMGEWKESFQGKTITEEVKGLLGYHDLHNRVLGEYKDDIAILKEELAEVKEVNKKQVNLKEVLETRNALNVVQSELNKMKDIADINKKLIKDHKALSEEDLTDIKSSIKEMKESIETNKVTAFNTQKNTKKLFDDIEDIKVSSINEEKIKSVIFTNIRDINYMSKFWWFSAIQNNSKKIEATLSLTNDNKKDVSILQDNLKNIKINADKVPNVLDLISSTKNNLDFKINQIKNNYGGLEGRVQSTEAKITIINNNYTYKMQSGIVILPKNNPTTTITCLDGYSMYKIHDYIIAPVKWLPTGDVDSNDSIEVYTNINKSWGTNKIGITAKATELREDMKVMYLIIYKA